MTDPRAPTLPPPGQEMVSSAELAELREKARLFDLLVERTTDLLAKLAVQEFLKDPHAFGRPAGGSAHPPGPAVT